MFHIHNGFILQNIFDTLGAKRAEICLIVKPAFDIATFLVHLTDCNTSAIYIMNGIFNKNEQKFA